MPDSSPSNLARNVIAALVVVIVFWALKPGSNNQSTPAPATPQFAQDRYASAPNALGEYLSLSSLAGKFVWVDYAAEWCSGCAPQSSTIRTLTRNAPQGVTFVTVMTSELDGYGHPATRDTALKWARRFSLDEARVVAADLTSMTLPQHALFSPQGVELYRHVGQLSGADIQNKLSQHMQRD